jgi:DNA-binding NarL/FixJ family response regulator
MSSYIPIRIIIADDHEMVIEGLHVILKKTPEVEIIGEASNGEQLLRLTRQLKPDVVLTDIKMPLTDGVTATKKIKEEFPHIGIVAISSYDEGQFLLDMVKAGAKGFLLKTASRSEIVEAIKKASIGESFYCAHSRDKLSEIISRSSQYMRGAEQDLFTDRELQIIQLICEGLSSKQIAYTLSLKTRTIESYREKIMMKMDVNNSAGLVIYAVNHALYKDPVLKSH